MLRDSITVLKQPPAQRPVESVQLLGVLLVDHLRAFSNKLPFNHLCVACRALTYSHVPAGVRLTNADESGQTVFRVLLTGTVLVQRRFSHKTWLPVGFLSPGDTLGLMGMLESAPDEIRYTTMAASEFAVLRRFEFERCLRSTYEKAITENIQLLQLTPSFAGLPEATLKQLVSSSRQVTLQPGELLTREGDATDELFVLKSGAVRLVKVCAYCNHAT